jgi:MoxR-like ATPase
MEDHSKTTPSLTRPAAPEAPPASTPQDIQRAKLLVRACQKITEELSHAIVGQTEVIEQLLIAILARGHCLLEGVPGLAKTAMVRCLSRVMNLSFRRIQFTPDLMPADITGTDIIQEDPATGRRSLNFQKGPIFAQMILADEINRTPPKTQAALLEAMQEHSATVGGRTYALEEPFFVLATQNPIEQEGTYPLPEAQKDRFMFLIRVRYPKREEEREIVHRTTSAVEMTLKPIIGAAEILACQDTVRRVPVPKHVMDFVLDVVGNTRAGEPGVPDFVKDLLAWGAGPRASQQWILGGKVRAILHGRFHVTIEDLKALAKPVLRHRIVPTFNAEAERITADDIIDRVITSVPISAKNP